MKLDQFYEYMVSQPLGDYIVLLQYKYDFEYQYETSKQVMTVCVDHIEWLNDWNEGQTDVDVLGYCPVDEVKCTHIPIQRRKLDE